MCVTIYFLSYQVQVFTPEEVEKIGPYGIKLVPSTNYDVNKRMWMVRADSEESQNQWIEVGYY